MLICEPLENAGFANGFSTRIGGVSPFPKDSLNLAGFDDDTAENIHENRRRFLSIFEKDYKLTTAWQVHGDNVRLIENESDGARGDERADALVSNLGNMLIGVKTADCVPILLGDPDTKAFAAVHAGWRGTVQTIVKKAIDKMMFAFAAKPENLIAAIGPAAACENYEVGTNVIEAFMQKFREGEHYFRPTRKGHALVDLHRANKDQLIDSGAVEKNIYTAPFCTISRTDLFFSYRVEKQKYGKTGRLLSVIGRKAS
ncbi:MAG: peptidoglycan editing factor PgeF [Acidobacteria bacterium]|nr:peptidoglycan editing factor PgeF [Acidobacteriota bacterium]